MRATRSSTCGNRLIALALLVLAVAVDAEPLLACPLAAGARALLDIPAKDGQGSLAVYPLGFSRAGSFAWLERRQGFDDEGFQWSLQIVDLARNRALHRQRFALASPRPQDLCKKRGAILTRLLEQHEVTPSRLSLEKLSRSQAMPQVELRPVRVRADSYRTPYVLTQRGPGGVRNLGRLWQVDASSGEAASREPRALGFIRNPAAPGIAVFVTQEMIGTEGVVVTLVHVFGAGLDSGGDPPEPPVSNSVVRLRRQPL